MMDDEQTAAVGSILMLAVRASISVHNYKNAIFLAERLVVEGTPHTYVYAELTLWRRFISMYDLP
jgi:hypothetical protein